MIEHFLRVEGRSTHDIAERLHLSVKTVETHRAQLMQRLEIFDVAGLTRYALRIGLIDPERRANCAAWTWRAGKINSDSGTDER